VHITLLTCARDEIDRLRLAATARDKLLRKVDIKAEAGLCQMSHGGTREFLKDIRRIVRDAGLQGGLTEFKDGN
jgi:hypothetical protein